MTTTAPRLSPDQLWAAVDAQRQLTVDLLASLDPADWARPSLCSEWTVKDVAGHLVWHRDAARASSLPSTIAGVVRARGDIPRATSDLAQRWVAARTLPQLVAELRDNVGHHKPPIGTTDDNMLIDTLVHHHDIALALGRGLEGDPQVAARTADLVLGLPARFAHPVTGRLAALRWRATDADWERGDGALVEGPMMAILVALMGRPAALEHLHGPGLEQARTLMGEPTPGRSG